MPHRHTAVAIALALTWPAVASAQAFMEARDPEGEEVAETLPLTAERLDVSIDRQFATSTITQTFANRSDVQQEGRYSLTLGEGAKVTGFAYWNGKKKIVGEVFEKAVAEEVYGEVTGIGRDPGLFQQVGEGAFTFRVFPIEAREEKHVEVTFGRYLPRSGDTYEYRLALGDADADINVDIADDRDILAIESPTHTIEIDGKKVHARGSGDFVLRVKLDEQPLAVRARVHRDADNDAYVLISMGAPDAADTAVVPKDVTIVIDHSGSMQGDPMAHALAAADQVIEKLRADDRVNVIVFDDTVDKLYDQPKPVTDAVRTEARAYVDKVQSDGGTEIALALGAALKAQIVDDHPDVILFMTDGQSDAQSALDVARKDKGDARVFTIGIGTGVEKPLLARLAGEKRGRFTFIPDTATIEAGVVQVFEQIDHPVMVDVEVTGAQQIYPQTIPDLTRGEELVVAARLSKDSTIMVSGIVDGKKVERTLDVTLPAEERRSWVGRTWAGARVEHLLEEIALDGETEELTNETIELALAYNLVTPYTSFLAIPESELTDDVAQTLADARARKQKIQAAHKDALALSRDDMPPGDPVLTVHAPKDAQQVTAYFPFGLVKDLGWDAQEESWKVRFLVPNDVPDGVYQAKVVIVRADGTIELAKATYTIDSTEPDFVVELSQEADGSVKLHVTGSAGVAAVTVALVSDPQVRVTLVDVGGGVFEGVIAAPAGAALRVVAADGARNEADRLVTVQ